MCKRPAAFSLRGAYTTPLLQGFHFISGIQFNLVVVVFQYFLIFSTGCGHFEEPKEPISRHKEKECKCMVQPETMSSRETLIELIKHMKQSQIC